MPIICPEHGEFWKTPNDFLDGHACPKCGRKNASEKLSIDQDEFLKRCKTVHGDKYDYTETVYDRWEKKVKITCPKHGEFWQTPHAHIGSGYGCPKCARERQSKHFRLTTEEFILKGNKVHKGKYDYSKVEYKTCVDKVCIICPKHGEFWQIAQDHLSGHGCPKCSKSKMEGEIMDLLQENHISFTYNKFYKQLDGLQLDFYIPSRNIAIECQGIHHFKPIPYDNDIQKAKKAFEELIERDKKKYKLCQELGVTLLYYSTVDADFSCDIFIDKNKLLNFILNAPEITQDRLREIY